MICPLWNLIAIIVFASLHGVPSSGFATCLPMEKNNAGNTPLSCNFSDIQGKWNPMDPLNLPLGTMDIRSNKLRFEHGKTVHITVIQSSHPIMLKLIEHQFVPYTRVEVYIPPYLEKNGIRVLCFHEYEHLADAEADKDAELDNHPSYIHCYGEAR